jgi:acyl carrier protein
MLSEAQIIQLLINYLQTELSQNRLLITPETALIEAGLIDSLTIFKLIVFLEEHFTIKIQAEDIVVENFKTVCALQALVQRKLPFLNKV